MSIDSPVTIESPVALSEQNKASLARVRPMIAAMRATKPVRYVADVTFLWRAMKAAAPRVRANRTLIMTMPGFKAEYVDCYGDIGNAVLCIHGHIRLYTEYEDDLYERSLRLMKRRTSMQLAYDHLADMGLLDPAKVAKIREGSGYDDTLDDVLLLIATFVENKDKLANKHAISDTFLNETAKEAEEFGTALTDRAKRDKELESLKEDRAAAVALAAAANKAVRTAADYFELDEREGLEFAPSIFVAGPGRVAESAKGTAEERAVAKAAEDQAAAEKAIAKAAESKAAAAKVSKATASKKAPNSKAADATTTATQPANPAVKRPLDLDPEDPPRRPFVDDENT